MDYTLFIDLVQNLLGAQVFTCDASEADFKPVEEKYCYRAELQPLFTASALETLSTSLEEGVIDVLRDSLGIWMQMFRFEDRFFLVGPYVKQVFDPVAAQRTLLSRGLPAAYAASLRLYYAAFPILSSTQVRSTITACLSSLNGKPLGFSSRHIENILTTERSLSGKDRYAEELDYSSVYTRYDLENRFLHMVETGDSEHVLLAYQEMSVKGAIRNRYTNAIYQNPLISLSMLRALARKAAERAGVSAIEIDEITQRSAQQMMSARNVQEQDAFVQQMILELTDAVRHSRFSVGSYSKPIRRVVEYLQLNYSQNSSLDFLAELSGLSPCYLSHQFKKEVGVSIQQFILHIRCGSAAELLRTTKDTIQEISAYVGYLDNNYFVKVFKKQFGMTPGEYRSSQKG